MSRQSCCFCILLGLLVVLAPALALTGETAWQDPPDDEAAPAPADKPGQEPTATAETEDEPIDFFARGAFPPTLPDTELHEDPWSRRDCLLCHRWGIYDAPIPRHEGMPSIVLTARCRTCHVTDTSGDEKADAVFARNAFPPTLPDDKDHQNPWAPDEDCLECHKSGKDGAGIVRHDGMPKVLLTARCRTCHVLVRGPEPAGELE